MSELLSMATALLLIVIILLSSGSRLLIRHRFQKNLRPHLEALERASAKNAELKVTTE